MSLTDKIVKHKRLQRLSGSLAMIVPESWIRDMEWKRDTNFAMEFKPFTKQIIITEEIKRFKTLQPPKSFGNEDEDEFHGKDPGDPIDNPDGEKTSELVTV